MTAAWLGPCWFAAVLYGAWRYRPRPTRVHHLLPAEAGERATSGTGPLERLGRPIRQALRRAGHRAPDGWRWPHTDVKAASPEDDRAADRAAGTLVVVGLGVAAGLSPWLAPVAVGLVAGGRVVRRQATHRRQARRVADDLPDVVDLFILAAGAGLTVALAIDSVARHGFGPVAEALRSISRSRAMGERTADALERLPSETGEAIRPLVDTLVASERYGTALVPALTSLAEELSGQRRRRAEERARRAPVKLIFPLVLCALPAFALLTVVPLLLSTLGSLRF